jgi:NAD-dependent deacetylase
LQQCEPSCTENCIFGILERAERIAVLTGADVSAANGIPTFRKAQTGLWARFSPEELASPEAYAKHPALVWQ